MNTGKKFHRLLAAIRFFVLSFIGVVNVIDVDNVVYAVDAVRCIFLFLVNVGEKFDLLIFVNRFFESILLLSTRHSYFACLSLTEHGK